jgi:acyl carrier protein
MKTEEKLIGLIRAQMEDAGEIDLQDHIVDIGYDSLKFIELVIKIEMEFGFEFSDDDLNYQRFTTVRDISDYINEKMQCCDTTE